MATPLPWYKRWSEYRNSDRFRDVSISTGVLVGACRDIFDWCLDAARAAGRTGKVPELSGASAVALGADNGISADDVFSVLTAFRAVGMIDARGRIYRWADMQLSDEEKKEVAAKRSKAADYKRQQRARKAGKPAPEPAPALKPEPAPKPEPKPAPRPEPAPKPAPAHKAGATSAGHSAGLLPGLAPELAQEDKPKKAQKPKKPATPGLSKDEQAALFDEFWAVAGDPNQADDAARRFWMKAVHTLEQARLFTDRLRRAQALQDARGITRHNVMKFINDKSKFLAPVHNDEAVFQAELAKCSKRSPSGFQTAAERRNANNKAILEAAFSKAPEHVSACVIGQAELPPPASAFADAPVLEAEVVVPPLPAGASSLAATSSFI